MEFNRGLKLVVAIGGTFLAAVLLSQAALAEGRGGGERGGGGMRGGGGFEGARMGGAGMHSDRPMMGGGRSGFRGGRGLGVRGGERSGFRGDDRFRFRDRDDRFFFGDRDDFLFAPRGVWNNWWWGAPTVGFGLGIGPVGPGFDRDDWRFRPIGDRDD